VPEVTRRVLGGLALTMAFVTLGSPSAWARVTPDGSRESDTTASADSKGDTVSATAGAVVFDRAKNGSGPSTGAVTSTTTWTPPACYYAPKYTPATLKAYLEPIWEAESTGSQWDLEQRNKYENGGKTAGTYKDFNKGKTGKGYWWDSYVTKGREGDPGALDCTRPIFWVDNGEAPPADIPQAITPQMLAELAYAEIRVPSTKVELAPQGTTKVNLKTWAWLDAARFKPVSVTASVPLLGVSATTTAEPVSMTIKPGTDDAATYPASGRCAIHDGQIGEPYVRGKADETPPCGVQYLRSSGDGSYKLQATITWKISWTSTTGQGGDLPDGTFGADQDVVVQEIQAVNR
jgi:enoyl reductase